jgi:hypothetical protein
MKDLRARETEDTTKNNVPFVLPVRPAITAIALSSFFESANTIKI